MSTRDAAIPAFGDRDDAWEAASIDRVADEKPPPHARSRARGTAIASTPATPWRSAVLLVAGDKSGQWSKWYRDAIPRAEQLHEDYLAERRKEMGT
jgi:hypothetical protein